MAKSKKNSSPDFKSFSKEPSESKRAKSPVGDVTRFPIMLPPKNKNKNNKNSISSSSTTTTNENLNIESIRERIVKLDYVTSVRVNEELWKSFQQLCRFLGIKQSYMLNLLIASLLYGDIKTPTVIINMNLNLNLLQANTTTTTTTNTTNVPDFVLQEVRELEEKLAKKEERLRYLKNKKGEKVVEKIYGGVREFIVDEKVIKELEEEVRELKKRIYRLKRKWGL